MLQYKIPQNVQVEDRIMSFLTIRQLVISMIGGGIAYVIYISLSSSFYIEVWGLPVFLVSAITICVAFVKINDIRFTKWILLLLEFLIRPRKRIWDKTFNTELIFAFVTSKRGNSAQEPNKNNGPDNDPKKDFSALDEITRKLDKNPFEHIEKKLDRTDNFNDNRLNQAVLLSEDELVRHEKRIDQAMQANQDRRNSASKVVTTAVVSDQINVQENTATVDKKKLISNLLNAQHNIAKNVSKISDNPPPVQQTKEPKNEHIVEQKPTNQSLTPNQNQPSLNNANKEKFKVIDENQPNNSSSNTIIPIESQDDHHEEIVKISKDDFLKNKQKNLFTKRAFPMPSIQLNKQTVDSQNSTESNVQAKKFRPVRDDKQINTKNKPQIPEEHKTILSNIKEGEVSINFSKKDERSNS